MFSRVQPSTKGNPRKRQKISHSPEPGTEAGASTMATLSSMPTTAMAEKNCDKVDCLHEQSLKRLEPDLEAMRQLITCKVCQRFLSEPYSLACGHTYCYECLDAWLVDQKKRTCPGCRAVINQQPTPSYVIREMTLIFTSRAELLPDGETLQEHEDFAKEAAEKVARDRENKDARHGGLFRGTFNAKDGMRATPLHDPGDGVDRCPNCHWEVEHGVCQSCGLTMGDEDGGFSDSDESSDSDGDSELDHELMREIEAEADDRAAFDDVFGVGEDALSVHDDDFIDEEGNIRPHDDPPNHGMDHLYGPFAAGRQVFWGGGEDSDDIDSDGDSEMEGFIDDDPEEDGTEASNSDEDEEDDHVRLRRLHRRAPRLADSDEEDVASNASNGPRVMEIDSNDEEEDEEDEGPVALGSQRTKANRNSRRQQVAYSSEEDESGCGSNSGSNSDSGSSSDSESDSGSESDTSSSATPHAEDTDHVFTTGGALQTGAFSPLQGDDASESGYDIHDYDHDDNDDDDDDDENDEDDEYGGADLDPYAAGYGAYNDEEATRADTPEADHLPPISASHRLLKRQRRRVRHAERTAVQRTRSPTGRARQSAGPDHPFQLSDTLVRINERQRRLGSG